jgi:hypothetical protein
VVVAILSPLNLHGGNRKTKRHLLHNTRIHATEGHFGNSHHSTIGWMPGDRNSLSLDARHAIPTRVCRFEVARCARIVSPSRASGLGFVAQPRNPDSFVVNRRKPRGLSVASMPIPLKSWLPRRPGSTLVLRLNQEIVLTSSCFCCHHAAST